LFCGSREAWPAGPPQALSGLRAYGLISPGAKLKFLLRMHRAVCEERIKKKTQYSNMPAVEKATSIFESRESPFLYWSTLQCPKR